MVQNRWLPTIRSKLYCLVLTMFVPVLLLQAWYVYERFQSRQANELQINLEMARAVAGTLNMFVQDVLHQELAICINLTMPQDFSIEQMNQILEANRVALPAIRNFAWVNPQGRILASNMARVIGEDIADRSFVRAITEGGEWSVSDLMLSRGTGEPVFSISRGIRDGEGKLLGMVVGAIRADNLNGILGLELSRSGSISILDGRAMLVDCYPQRVLKWEDRDFLQKRPVIRQALEGKEVTGIFPSVFNEGERIVTCTPNRFTNWVVCVSRSKSEVMAPIRSQAIEQATLSLLLTAVIFIAAFFLSHGIVGPIGRLRDYAMALGRGEPMDRVEFKSSVELQDLASSFNAMADEIANREDGLRKSEQEKVAILGSLKDVAIEYLDPEMRVIWTNMATDEVFSLAPEKLKGKYCYKAIHGLSEPCSGCIAIRALETGEPHEGEIMHADGRAWLVCSNPVKDSSGKVTNIVHAAMNITARKRMEEALRGEISEREQVEAIRQLDEARLEALWQLSQMTESSTYQTARFALEQLVKLTESEVGWIGFLDEAETVLTVHCWPENNSHAPASGNGSIHLPVEEADIFADAIREKRVVVMNDYSRSGPDVGGCLPSQEPLARVMIVPIFEDHRVVAIAGVGNKSKEYNSSDARQLTLLMDGTWKIIQRERAEKNLRESESLAAMGRAMAAVAHDLKTPLIAIGGFTCLALKRIENDSPIRDKLEIVVKETQRMENMVKNMLDFSRPLELECSEGDIASLVAECLIIVSPLAQKKKIQLCSRVDPCIPPVVYLDFPRMKQALINLMTNGIQASQEGGDVMIECNVKGGNLLINVIDCGCGIPADKRDEIFSPFYTTKKEGTGLGLPIVKKIVEAHRGQIEIFGNPGKGITFRVEIPTDLFSYEISDRVVS